MSAQDLSPELVALIISFVLDQDALRHCCLVSKAWRSLAQPLLWSEMNLKAPEDCDKWEAKLEEFAHLAEYVQAVNILGPSSSVNDLVAGSDDEEEEEEKEEEEEEEEVEHPDEEEPDDSEPFSMEVVPAEFFSKLPNVSKLSIERMGAWSDEERAIQPLTSVTSLSIFQGFFYPQTFFELVEDKSLTSLSLSEIQIRPDDAENMTYEDTNPPRLLTRYRQAAEELVKISTAPSFIPHKLKSVALDETVFFLLAPLTWLCSPAFDLSEIHKVVLNWNGQADLLERQVGNEEKLCNKFRQFLSLVAPSVRDLSLRHRDGVEEWANDAWLSDMIDGEPLPIFQELRTLFISSPQNYNQISLSIMMPLIPKITAPELEELVLTIRFYPTYLEGFTFEENEDWPVIDETLSGSHFPSLKRVLIVYNIKRESGAGYDPEDGEPKPATDEEASTKLKACLPLLEATGRLTLKQVDNHHKLPWSERFYA